MSAKKPRICKQRLKWALSEDSRQKGKWKSAIYVHGLQDGKKKLACSRFLKFLIMSSKKQQIKTSITDVHRTDQKDAVL